MQFNSYSYLFILAWVVTAFWMLPPSARRVYLLAVSLTFYFLWSGPYILVPIALALITYLCVSKISNPSTGKRLWLWLGIAFALICLIFFRFQVNVCGMALAIISRMRLTPAPIVLTIGVPIGISFYCFEAIGLVIDSNQGRVKKLRLTDVLLFLSFWPTVTSGPILRFRELTSQLSLDRTFDPEFVVSGLDRIVLGLVQKNLIANSLSGSIAEGFISQGASVNTTIDNWFLAIAYGLQIYFDFAAYSNMAIGAARLIGIKLPENFHFPYHAKNPSDFWARWHMSLSRWIRDYLFFPVNVRFKGRPMPLYISLIVIMALVGIWHGAGWGFLLWGIMHGCYLVLYRFTEDLTTAHWPKLENSRLFRAAWQFITLIAVFAAWIPFRAGTLHQSASMLRSMFFTFNFSISYQLNFYLVTMLIAAWCACEPYFASIIERFDQWSLARKRTAVANLYLIRPLAYAFALLLFFAFDELNTGFIYFQF